MKREAALHTAVNAILKKMVRLGEKIATLVFNLTIFYMGWVLAEFVDYSVFKWIVAAAIETIVHPVES